MSQPISVTILTKNSQKHLVNCLNALQRFQEVIVLDNGSTDNTIALAEKYSNVKIVRSPFLGFGPLKNLAAQHALNPWILSIDSDEVLTPELEQEILRLDLSAPNIVYSFKRNNYYRNKLIKACGWDNDYVLRLYNKNATSFADLSVHEYIQTTGMQVQQLKGLLNHYTYDSISQLISKSDKYTSLFAEENKFIKNSSPFKSYYKWAFSFFRNYILQKGFLYGYEGLTISFTNAANSFYKYMKLHEANQQLQISIIMNSFGSATTAQALLSSINTQQEVPEEVILVDTEANYLSGRLSDLNLPVRSCVVSDSVDDIFELQQAVTMASGEYIIVLNSKTLIPEDFTQSCRRKARKGTFIYQQGLVSFIAFWKNDFLELNYTRTQTSTATTKHNKLVSLFLKKGLKQV